MSTFRFIHTGDIHLDSPLSLANSRHSNPESVRAVLVTAPITMGGRWKSFPKPKDSSQAPAGSANL